MYAEGVTAVLGARLRRRGPALRAGDQSAPAPGWRRRSFRRTGRVVRLTDDGELEVVATGSVFPTGMAFGPDGTSTSPTSASASRRAPARSSPSIYHCPYRRPPRQNPRLWALRKWVRQPPDIAGNGRLHLGAAVGTAAPALLAATPPMDRTATKKSATRRGRLFGQHPGT